MAPLEDVTASRRGIGQMRKKSLVVVFRVTLLGKNYRVLSQFA